MACRRGGDSSVGEDKARAVEQKDSPQAFNADNAAALVNFTDSLVYGPELEDIFSSAFNEISEAVVDTLESDYNRIPGVQTVSVVLIKKMIREDGVDVFVEMDVGSDYNSNDEQIRSVLHNVVKEGSIASYVTSVQGFQFRRLGEVNAGIRPCMSDEHRCGDGTCILAEYLCDNRPDCRDMSDETNCETKGPTPAASTTPATTTTTTVKKPPRPPSPPGPCRADQATCQSGECIPRDYVCDGERDCSDGSDEFRCGTPSPCEPNEFKCRNGRCALKLWRCDGDNDCEDNSDETDCPRPEGQAGVPGVVASSPQPLPRLGVFGPLEARPPVALRDLLCGTDNGSSSTARLSSPSESPMAGHPPAAWTCSSRPCSEPWNSRNRLGRTA
ncbi:Basement membrane-specific heparan sulfate proteoglycan core protein [Liparis tanakae]|uniref:Basement membrane-specific heparan sulfate proteoglycan core protein n=1 Tax=Liparis tanakae TaxID=230148 RepID=A0A4Z2FS48_9TELE|nr:Basement membrane-specific heparan sulfate proteoglycan core protein [Liparis tanakae]